MYSSLSWVPRGVAEAKLPEGVQHENDMDITESEQGDQTSTPESNEEMQVEEDESEVDIASILANDLNTLSFHKKNEDDPYLQSDPNAKEIFDEEELDDLVIRPTDALIIATKSGDDASTLEVHLFDDDPDASDNEEGAYEPHTYVHHDLVLPVLPLCTAYTNITLQEKSLNLVAVGMFTPGIDIWDVDRVNDLEPLVSLGGFDRYHSNSSGKASAGRGQKKKKRRLRLKEDSHKDAVMSLSWNNVQREYLASGSADSTVKIWDIESAHCANTLNHHKGKVQAVAFHPSESQFLLTGAFDRAVHIVDVRDGNNTVHWNVEADVEAVQWGQGLADGMVFVTTEDGYTSVFDSRKSGLDKTETHLARWQAHKGAATALSISHDIPGLMVTGGVDKMVKVWDVSGLRDGKSSELIYERPSKAGAIFALSLCPLPQSNTNASPFVVAYGGAQGTLRVVDLAVESEAVRDRFVRHCHPKSSAAIMSRSARYKYSSRSKGEVVRPCVPSESADSDSSESDSDHET